MHSNQPLKILSLLLQFSFVFGAPKAFENTNSISLKWIPRHATMTAHIFGRGASGSGGPLPTGTGSGLYLPTGTRPYDSSYPTGTGSYKSNSHPYSTGTQPQLQSSPTASSASPSCPIGTSAIHLPPQSPVYIGFTFALNYDFVAKNTLAQDEIFQYLPLALSYGLSVCPSSITLQALLPLDTTSTLYYITTLAQVQIPTASMDDFVEMICNKNSKVYNSPGNTATIENENELLGFVSQDRIYTEKPDLQKDGGPSRVCVTPNGPPVPKGTSARQGATNLQIAD